VPRAVGLARDTIRSVDLHRRVAHGERNSYCYEKLIIACGSGADTHGFALPASAHTLDSFEAASGIELALPRYLDEQGAKGHILISGAGYTGIELALCLRWMADRRGARAPISVVDPSLRFMPILSSRQRRRLEKLLGRRRIRLCLGTVVREATPEGVALANGERFEQPFLCWTAGARLSLDQLLGDVERLADGRLVVNERLQLSGHPEVLVAGDAAAWEGAEHVLRRAVNFAIGGGACAGSNAARLLQGRPLQRFRPIDLGWVIPLATSSVGSVFGRIPVGGSVGLRLHYLFSAYRSQTWAQRLRFLATALWLP
jgi:NADH dehydrogenase